MEIQLGNTSSPQRKIYKEFVVATTKTIHFLDTENAVSPNVVLAYSSGIDRYNYAYIPQLHRYYWVNAISEVIGGMCTLTLQTDVLMTYKPDIMDTTLMIVRKSTGGSGMIPDSQLPLYPYKNLKVIEFDNKPFFNNFDENTQCFCLTVAGK